MSQERQKRARPERRDVAPPAVYVSQHTAPLVFGFKTERAFLEFVQAHGVARTKVGKQVLVEVEELRATLRRLAVTASDLEAEPPASEPDALGSPDDILARLGLRRAG